MTKQSASSILAGKQGITASFCKEFLIPPVESGAPGISECKTPDLPVPRNTGNSAIRFGRSLSRAGKRVEIAAKPRAFTRLITAGGNKVCLAFSVR
jgi:hypothetical protein